MDKFHNCKVAVVVPSFKVKGQILRVLARMGPEVKFIYVVDDCCPDGSGKYVEENCGDSRVTVLYHDSNRGVGGAVISGYLRAIQDGAEIVVKIDGDGQMDPSLIYKFITPILLGQADYSKGNRFYYLKDLFLMPLTRLIGNSGLSFLTKLSTGYWDIMDPTNGYTAIHAALIKALPLDKIDNRYFFETDLLFRLNLQRAVVIDVPMLAQYGDEVSNLSVIKTLFSFPWKHLKRWLKRVLYRYIILDFNPGSVSLVGGLAFSLAGILFGGYHWMVSSRDGIPAHTGTVILPAMIIIVGFQMLLHYFSYDCMQVPRFPVHPMLKDRAD